MKVPTLLLLGAAALAAVAMACGGDDDATGDATGDQLPGDSSSGGMTRPNTWLEFDGERYQLVNLLVDGREASAGEFTEAGTYANADIDPDSGTAYRRAGDPDGVWTFSAPSGDDPDGLWLRWATGLGDDPAS